MEVDDLRIIVTNFKLVIGLNLNKDFRKVKIKRFLEVKGPKIIIILSISIRGTMYNFESQINYILL